MKFLWLFEAVVISDNKKSRSPANRVGGVSITLFVIYLGILFWASFNPQPIDAKGPIHALTMWLVDLAKANQDLKWLDYNMIESIANVLLYIPLGLGIAALVKGLPWWGDVLLGVAVTLTAEFGQMLFLPNRFATVMDVWNNSLGVLLGVVILKSIVRLRELRLSQG